MATPILWGTSDFLVNTTTDKAQGAPQSVGLPDGTFVVIWNDASGIAAAGGSDWDVRGQIFYADGTKKGTEFLVNGTMVSGTMRYTGVQSEAKIAVLNDGRFVVAWSDSNDYVDGTVLDPGGGVRARIYNADGTPAPGYNQDGTLVPVGDFHVNLPFTGKQAAESIAPLANGGFVITYSTTPGMDPDIRAQAYDASGRPLGGEVSVNTTTTNPQRSSSVVGLNNGNYAVFWEDLSKSADDPVMPTVRGRIFKPDGTPVTPEFLAPSSRGPKGAPSVTALTNGKFVVVWEHQSPDAGDGSEGSIKAQMYNADGSMYRGEFLINSRTIGHQEGAFVVALPDGGFAVSYTNGRKDYNIFDSYGIATFDGTGQRTGDDYIFELPIGARPVNNWRSNLAALSDGRLVFSWSETNSQRIDDPLGVHARILDPRDRGITLTGKDFDDDFIGTNFADSLSGKEGNDRLRGAGGNDTLVGGKGADILDGGDGSDTASYADADAEVVANLVSPAANSGDAAGDTYISIENLIGSKLGDKLTGNNGENVIDGGDGNDTLVGGGGNDSLLGGKGNDSLDGGTGVDTLIGGAGNDTYLVDDAKDKVEEAVGGGIDVVIASVSYALDANAEVEELRAVAGAAKINLTGNGIANKLVGNNADNVLDGGGGADYMEGGVGNDTYVVDDEGDVVVEAAGDDQGFDTVVIGADFAADHTYRLAAFENIEALTALNSAGDITLVGNSGANIITGNDGANGLDGGNDTVVDTLKGGKGDDTYYIRHQGDVLVELDGQGTDTALVSAAKFELDADVSIEIIKADTSGGANAFALTGNNLANTIKGAVGSDTLDGGGALDDRADQLEGGNGDDTYYVRHKGDVVVEGLNEGEDKIVAFTSYTLKNGTYVETLEAAAGVENLTLTGNNAANVIKGNALANTLDGGQGADYLAGGDGDDVYYVDDQTDRVVEAAVPGGISRDVIVVTAGIAYVLDNDVYVEELRAKEGVAVPSLTGNARANTIIGNSGDNTLDGGGGGDILQGGLGDDTYIVRTGDIILEAAEGGVDTAIAQGSFTLSRDMSVEILKAGSAAGLALTGNNLVNTIIGGAGNDTLDGGGGADVLEGGAGNDTYIIGNASVTVKEEAGEAGGYDTAIVSKSITLAEIANVEALEAAEIAGAAGNIDLTGDGGNNRLVGNSGNNRLDGGAGQDILIGGKGNDTYIVDDLGDVVSETLNSEGGTDTVITSVDFTLGSSQFIEVLKSADTSAVRLAGNGLANTLLGGGFDDTLDGGGGGDSLSGGAGNDTYIVHSAKDQITDLSGTDTVVVGFDYTLAGGTGIEVLKAADGVSGIKLTGNTSANTLIGSDGADVLDGNGGPDVLRGGKGDDTYLLTGAGVTIEEAADGGNDTVIVFTAKADLSTFANVENLAVAASVTTGVELIGNSEANGLTGGVGDDTLRGGGGADTLSGGKGDDTYFVDDAKCAVVETMNGGGGTDTVVASVDFTLGSSQFIEVLKSAGTSAVRLTGNGLANTLLGGGFDDTLDGGGGGDSLSGGAGNDTYIVHSAKDQITDLAGTADTVVVGFDYTLAGGTGIEVLKAADGVSGIKLTGNTSANTLIGSDGADVLEGGGGPDVLRGGKGDDTYQLKSAGVTIEEAADGGNDTVIVYTAKADLSGFANVENLTVAASVTTGVELIGNSEANGLTGGVGDDTLRGGGGADTLSGGKGDDTYFVDDAKYVVVETLNGGGGTDTVVASVDFTLGSSQFIEVLKSAGTSAIRLTGNGLENTLLGGGFDDTLDGGGGGDSLSGGAGNDTYFVRSAKDQITDLSGTDTVVVGFDYTLSAGAGIEILKAADDVSGIKLTGNALANTLVGSDGADVLNGGGGADVLRGGKGNDTYLLTSAGVRIEEVADGGNDTIIVYTAKADLNDFPNVENLTVADSVTTGVELIGNSGANNLTGGVGDDTLRGGGGADTLNGGKGDDTYFVDSANVTIIDTSGTDTVVASVDYTLGAGLENLRASGTGALKLTGNELNNVLIGNDAANVLDGGAGADTMQGGAGDDIYHVDQAADMVVELTGQGYDTVLTSVSYSAASADIEAITATGTAAIRLTGNALVNTLIGNDAANTLDGGAGADSMAGGAGDDIYYVDSAGDTITDTSGKDIVFTSVSYTLSGASGIETLAASSPDDVTALVLSGNSFDNTLIGNAGKNKLMGELGNDTLSGGLGNDTLTGGKGKDIFVFDTKLNKKTNFDKITDYVVKDDSIYLDNAIFKKLGKKGTPDKPVKMTKGFFTIGDAAKDKDDYIIYNAKKGILYYDADGDGAGKAVEIATLKKNLKMTAAEFFVI
ncbi:calcium-binding protein [Microvirga alba]|uniref:Calcium-binding protein n=1 Tax=Microvirga alba TaxID=2791025 RepID=A0A931FPQ6_9HYPH|nr:hypothetical protein [Microvirga alba]MBF9235025.1 hypothetical protein [Microvirga alba]